MSSKKYNSFGIMRLRTILSSSTHPRPPHNNDSLSVNKPCRTDKNFHGIRGTKARDTKHKLTGYGAHLTGYEARVSRDTGHTIDGIRGTGFTGYEAQKKW